jgi:hypothetical protein
LYEGIAGDNTDVKPRLGGRVMVMIEAFANTPK